MAQKRALFLDRDGVINVDREYVHRCEEFTFLDGIFELCRAAQELDYLLIVVTNQAGIARGFYTEAQFAVLTAWMTREFEARDVRIARVYYCPYHPTEGIGEYRKDSPDRKPKPGMLFRARAEFDLTLAESALIGDRASDIEAARAAGVGTRIWLRSQGLPRIGAIDPQSHVAESLHEIRERFFTVRN